MSDAHAVNKDERKYDGRANFAADDEIEALLEAHFAAHGLGTREVPRSRRPSTARNCPDERRTRRQQGREEI